jgi:hypothetical protein
MLTTPHLLVGGAIGTAIANPYLAVPIAASSHFLLDGIPHLMGIVDVEDLDKKDVLFVLGDVFLGLSILLLLSLGNPAWERLWIGAFAAILPDFHHLAQVLFGPDFMQRYTHLHLKFHYKKDIHVVTGVATQLATVFLAITTIIVKR